MMSHRKVDGDPGRPRKVKPAGKGTETQGHANPTVSELRIQETKQRLSLRVHNDHCVRPFRFANIGPSGDGCRTYQQDIASVPRSPMSSYRGMPAGKLIEHFRTGK